MSLRIPLALALASSLALLLACASERSPSIAHRAESSAAPQFASPTGGSSTDASRHAAFPGSTEARDVVRTATVRLRAARPAHVVDAARRYVEAHEGYVDDSNTVGAGTASASSRATFRVPTASYSAAIAHLRSLATVLEIAEHGEDVTLVRADAEARIAAKRALEQRLVALAEHTGSVAELIQVENELGRVRGDVEAMEATQRALVDRMAYATITFSVESPEQPVVARAESFGSRLDRAVIGGLRAAEFLVTGTVALVLALSPALVLAFVGYVAFRLMRRRTPSSA